MDWVLPQAEDASCKDFEAVAVVAGTAVEVEVETAVAAGSAAELVAAEPVAAGPVAAGPVAAELVATQTAACEAVAGDAAHIVVAERLAVQKDEKIHTAPVEWYRWVGAETWPSQLSHYLTEHELLLV